MSVEEMMVKLDATDTKKVSASTKLVEVAMEKYTFGVSTLGESFALPRVGHKVVSMLRGSKSSLRGMLAKEYFRLYSKAAPQQALADALLVVEGMAQEAEPEELHLRVAPGIWLDLGDATGRAVHLTKDGWTVDEEVPILFKRTVLTGVLPAPEPGGSLDELLWDRLNVAKVDRVLVLTWLIATLFARIPHPVLSLEGEQGTAKTTAQRLLCSIIDPSPVISRKPPRDAEGWVTAAAGSWIVGIDNVSHVPDWLSDSICRAVTGDGDVRRKLYTDGEHAVFAFRRCVCLTSIDLGALRGDLAERALPIALHPIPDSKRLKESDIQTEWAKAHPLVLGAVLDVATRVIRALPSVELRSKPRMADFAEVLAAVDKVMDTTGFTRYLSLSGSMDRDAITSDPFLEAFTSMADDTFTGTSSMLFKALTPDKPPKNWPKDARAVTTLLKRHAPAMRRTGWTVDNDNGRNVANVLRWTIKRPEMPSNSAKSSSSSSCETRDTRVTGMEYGQSSYENGASIDALLDRARQGTPYTRERARELLASDLNDFVTGRLTIAQANHYLQHA